MGMLRINNKRMADTFIFTGQKYENNQASRLIYVIVGSIGGSFHYHRFIVDDVMIRKSNETVIEYNTSGKPVRYNSHRLICNER
jgi:hypothetical protein